MPGRLEFDMTFGRGSGGRREESDPMRLLVLGDFSGQPVGERAPLAERTARRIDPDTIGDVMRRFAPRMTIGSAEIAFRQLDDFHPDQLFAHLDLFESLRAARSAPPGERDDQVARLLGAPAAPATPAAAPATGLEALIRDAIAPHVVKDTTAQTASHVAATDSAIAHEMRTLLHDPSFQHLEGAWRGIRWLIAGLELDENLQLYLFDVTRDELLADIVAAQGKLAQTGAYRAIVDRTVGEVGWSAIFPLFRFGPSNAEIALLAALGLLASRAGGLLFGEADLALASEDAAPFGPWQALRHSEAAPWIGLAAPRLLLRLPYGERTDPIEAFTFEEIVGPPTHDELLWVPAALALALLVGRAFTARGWDMTPGDERLIGDLPAYTFLEDGESVLHPCTERALTERDADAILRAGLMPIAWRRDRDEAVVVRFQSIADPPAALAW